MPVANQLVRARPGDAGDVEAHARVFEHRQVSDVEQVAQVRRVGGGPRIGFGPTLVARPAGELDQSLSAVGVGLPRDVRRRDEFGPSNELHFQRHRSGHRSAFDF